MNYYPALYVKTYLTNQEVNHRPTLYVLQIIPSLYIDYAYVAWNEELITLFPTM